MFNQTSAVFVGLNAAQFSRDEVLTPELKPTFDRGCIGLNSEIVLILKYIPW